MISEVLQKTLLQLGLSAELVPGKPRGGQKNPAKAVCFSAPSQYELVIDGCKIAGSAQKRFGQAFLQHGSLPIEIDLDLLGRALRADIYQDVAESLATVGWLNRYSPRKLDVELVENTMADVFAEHLNVKLQLSEPTPEELQTAALFMEEKFGSDDWNHRR